FAPIRPVPTKPIRDRSLTNSTPKNEPAPGIGFLGQEIFQHLSIKCGNMLALLIAAIAVGLPSPSPSVSPSPLPVIAAVRVATGATQSLHGLPVAASLLDAAAIAHASAASGDALLRLLPGFDRSRSNSAFTNYGQQRVSFTGAGTDRGLVLADGIPAADGFGGQIDWAEYPADDIARVELLRGSGSALYGSGALGGVLQLETFAPSLSRVTSGFVTIGGGTHATVRNYARAGFSLSPQLFASLSAAQLQATVFDLPAPYASAIDRAAQSQSVMTSLRLRYAPSARTSFGYAYRGAWDDQQAGRPNYDFSRRLSEHSLKYGRSFAHSELTTTAFARDAFVTNRTDLFPSSPGLLRYVQFVPTNESGLSVDWRNSARTSEFSIRADGRAIGGDSSQFGANGAMQAEGGGSQRVGGITLQESVSVHRAYFVAGVSGEAVATSSTASRIDRAVSPRVAVRYDAARNVAVRISEGAGFRAPFLNELVRGFQIGPVKYLPNPSLVPERSSSLSWGLDWDLPRTRVALDGVHTFVNDAISFVTTGPATQLRENIGRTQTDGETLTLTHAFARGLRLEGFATAQYARVTSGGAGTIGKRLPYVPAVSAGVRIEGKAGAVNLGVSATYAGQTYADDLNLQPLGTAVLVGAHLSLSLRENARVVLDIENATSARYLSSVDRYGPPSTITLGLSVPVSDSR
ncbi:MAG: TonB-dependent receptor, partial [Candidatus Eremiobacteraeota bacterium]|nr:TonB-dependent receptor [Candidatus Eremiobacteraeota bacterium]